MRNRTLFPIVVLAMLPLGAHAAAARGVTILADRASSPVAAAAGTPRSALVWARLPERGAGLIGTVHIDAGLERLGFTFSFNPPDRGSLWARVWFGNLDDDGCTHEVVAQGTSRHTSSW